MSGSVRIATANHTPKSVPEALLCTMFSLGFRRRPRRVDNDDSLNSTPDGYYPERSQQEWRTRYLVRQRVGGGT